MRKSLTDLLVTYASLLASSVMVSLAFLSVMSSRLCFLTRSGLNATASYLLFLASVAFGTATFWSRS